MTEPRRTTSQANHEAIVTLRDLLDERICRVMAVITANKELEVSRHEAIDAKLKAAEEVLEARLILLNELRGDVLMKPEYTAQHEKLTGEFNNMTKLFQADISHLKEWRANQEGKASHGSVMMAGAIAVLGLVLSAVALIHELLST